jgi:DNA repair exonuclease SbcCD ATPase subunit
MMKAASLAFTLALLFAPGAAVSLSPITRVVELLQALAVQVEKDGKTETDLYENYMCWGKSVISQKTASNAAAEMKITELETYIADLEAGRIELTSERADLEKDIATLMNDLESAAALRKKEHEDFLEAELEMTKAIKALDEAIETLDEATKDHKEGVLLAVRSRLQGARNSGGMASLAAHQEALQQAVKLGEKFLDRADAIFLKRVLTGEVPDVPKADWKKLNRKATFKMKYKARSFKIQDTLKKLQQTFTINLKDAREKEDKDQKEYDALKEAKEGQLDAARDALAKMEKENGARGMSKQDAIDEVDALKKQVKDDTKFIEETEKALEDKKKSFKERQELRQGELGAISKAISILHNDDARDLFKRSFASQAPGEFLQIQQTSRSMTMAKGKRVFLELQALARRSGDQRLLDIARLAAEPEEGESAKKAFEPVIKAIDKMVKQLQEEETKDLEIKETCEEDRMKNTRDAIVAAREIDEMTDTINKLAEEIAECKKRIEELEKEHAEVEAALKKATRMREEEHAAWEVTDKDDKEAAVTVESAKQVLENFYQENGLVFAQKGKQPVTGMRAGEAPPPPPPTWEGGYGGKTGEMGGIVAILEMVHEDIVKDRADAKADEDRSQAEYDAFKKDSEDKMEAIKDDIEATEKRMGKAETEKTETESQRATKKGELNVILEKIRSINPNCEYFEVNYVMRRKNRQIEIDGLLKAKAILEGGEFDESDPNRELKPGDAFLQKRK